MRDMNEIAGVLRRHGLDVETVGDADLARFDLRYDVPAENVAFDPPRYHVRLLRRNGATAAEGWADKPEGDKEAHDKATRLAVLRALANHLEPLT